MVCTCHDQTIALRGSGLGCTGLQYSSVLQSIFPALRDSTNNSLPTHLKFRFPEATSSTKIWLSRVVCTPSNDLTLAQCRQASLGVNDCIHSQDIALRCNSSDSFNSGCKLYNYYLLLSSYNNNNNNKNFITYI